MTDNQPSQRATTLLDKIAAFRPKHINKHLFFVLITLLIFYPLVLRVDVLQITIDLFIFAALVTGVLAASNRSIQAIAAVIAGIVMLTSGWLWFLDEGNWLEIVSSVGAVIFLSIVATGIAIDVYSEQQQVTWDTIFGAINVYLMVGLAFAFVYETIYLIDPTAFEVSRSLTEDPEVLMVSLVYYSFVTLTTLGYGDITPKILEVGTISYMEALIGQIYLVVMVARLVSLHTSQK